MKRPHARSAKNARALIPSPEIWLGQSVASSVLTARLPETRKWPLIASLGDAMGYGWRVRSHFHGALREKLGVTGPLMIDSGGFSLMMREAPGWTAKRVAMIYRELDADVLVSLDHPPTSDDTPAERRKKQRRTLANLSLLADEFGRERLMPVVHGLTIPEIEENCAAVHAIVSRPHWIGVGGLVPLLKHLGKGARPSSVALQQRLGEVLGIVRRRFPHARLHVFGAGAPRSCLAAFAMGADSADSQGWRQAATFGSIYVPGKAQRILEWKHDHTQPRPLIDRDDRKFLGACPCPSCRRFPTAAKRIAELKRSFEPRAMHNAWVLRNEIKLYRAAKSEAALRRLLASRLPKSLYDVTIAARDALQAHTRPR